MQPVRLPRVAVHAMLATLLGIAALTLSHCTQVGDNLTGVGLNASGPTTCIKHCNDLYDLLFKLERKRHEAEKVICMAIDDNRLKNDCLNAESARHSARQTELGDAKKACQDGCHRQGVGSAG